MASSILTQQLHYDEKPFTLALLIPLGIGYGGFQANVIQLGIDQLTDASTTEITSFIVWYVWVFVSGRLPVDLINICLAGYKVFTPFLMSVFLTLATISLLLFNQVLIKEPATQNPFKLVYGVIKFLLKTNTQDKEVLSRIAKMNHHLALTLESLNMEAHSQQSRLKT